MAQIREVTQEKLKTQYRELRVIHDSLKYQELGNIRTAINMALDSLLVKIEDPQYEQAVSRLNDEDYVKYEKMLETLVLGLKDGLARGEPAWESYQVFAPGVNPFGISWQMDFFFGLFGFAPARERINAAERRRQEEIRARIAEVRDRSIEITGAVTSAVLDSILNAMLVAISAFKDTIRPYIENADIRVGLRLLKLQLKDENYRVTKQIGRIAVTVEPIIADSLTEMESPSLLVNVGADFTVYGVNSNIGVNVGFRQSIYIVKDWQLINSNTFISYMARLGLVVSARFKLSNNVEASVRVGKYLADMSNLNLNKQALIDLLLKDWTIGYNFVFKDTIRIEGMLNVSELVRDAW